MKNKSLLVVILIVCIAFSLLIVGCSPLGEEIGEVTITIECKTILNNMDKVEQSLVDNNIIPQDGIILPQTKVKVYSNESVYNVLVRVCKENKIALDCDLEPMFQTYYVKGINHIYELSVGSSSGWLYFVNGEQVNYGVSLYKLQGGENIKFAYTVVLGDCNEFD